MSKALSKDIFFLMQISTIQLHAKYAPTKPTQNIQRSTIKHLNISSASASAY